MCCDWFVVNGNFIGIGWLYCCSIELYVCIGCVCKVWMKVVIGWYVVVVVIV